MLLFLDGHLAPFAPLTAARYPRGARLNTLVAALAVALVAGGCGGGDERAEGTARAFTVERVVDGDTIEVRGELVRLVQIDAPELRERECYGRASRATLEELLPSGTRVRLEQDARLDFLNGRNRLDLDKVDRFGRPLAYVFKGDENLNVTMVERGAASVWFYGGKRGKFARQLLGAVRRARAQRRGLWRACPLTRFDPLRSLATRRR